MNFKKLETDYINKIFTKLLAVRLQKIKDYNT